MTLVHVSNLLCFDWLKMPEDVSHITGDFLPTDGLNLNSAESGRVRPVNL